MQTPTVALITSISFLMLLSCFTQIISRYIKIPFTIMLVAAGFIIASLSHLAPPEFAQLLDFQIHPDIILYACLPTLIFESAFAMDAQLFRHNLVPILMLAIPGLFLSTAIIGIMIYAFSSLDIMIALLLGAILSATDPVAVISLFNQLGVPKRLTVLVEGESLLNDSTAIVTAKTILAIMLAGTISTHTVVHGTFEFMYEFLGGIAVGMLITAVFGYLLEWLEEEPITQLSLAIILAYLSFIIADKVVHVSGVMATIAAGLMLAGWGKTKLSASAAGYLHELLKLLAYVANALIFLLVGFSIYGALTMESLYLLVIVIFAMLISRAIVVYSLIPLTTFLTRSEPIDLRYQTIMWWGGLRGAIALAIVLGMRDLPAHSTLVSVVMGAVLFTIIVQGLSINKLIQFFHLDKLILVDEVEKLEAEISSDKVMLKRLPALQKGGMFSLKIAESLHARCEQDLQTHHKTLENLRTHELDHTQERNILMINCFSVEKNLYDEMFAKGYLDSKAYRLLLQSLELKIDLVRYHSIIPEHTPVAWLTRFRNSFINFAANIPLFSSLTKRLKMSETITFYEQKWALYQGCLATLHYLEELPKSGDVNHAVLQEVRGHFERWKKSTKQALDDIAEQFPELVADMQNRLAERTYLYAKCETVTHQKHLGLLPEGIADNMVNQYMAQTRALRIQHPEKLELDKHELLKRVPFFASIEQSEIEPIIQMLTEKHISADEYIIREGEDGDELFLILRGVARVHKRINGQETEIATLIAGDFFGEMALLENIKRTASVKAVTPCIVYAMNRQGFEALQATFPQIRQAIQKVAEKRSGSSFRQ